MRENIRGIVESDRSEWLRMRHASCVSGNRCLSVSHVSLAEWIAYVFDHDVTDPAWHFAINARWLKVDPTRAAELIAFNPKSAPIIDAFPARTPGLRSELVAYAKQARTGCIL